ncbi:MAG: hypothetical protein WDA07_15250 [Leucobacter sp.]
MKLYKTCLTGLQVAASPEDIIAAFNDLPEWTRIRVAAGVVEILDGSQESSGWDALGLVLKADQLEREDAEKAQYDAEVEELAKLMVRHLYGNEEAVFTGGRQLARDILDAGYRKQADDE